MTNRLRIPNEPRFVRACALAVDPGDTLSLLMEAGAVRRHALGAVRRTRDVLLPVQDRASESKDWEQVHTLGVLREALAHPDSAVFLAYWAGDDHGITHTAAGASVERSAAPYAEALAIIGCAADSLGSRRRPWEIEGNDLSLPEWRDGVRKILTALPGSVLPAPSIPLEPEARPCTCSETDSPKAIAQEHADWCPAAGHLVARNKES
jgi:hypothetical protein